MLMISRCAPKRFFFFTRHTYRGGGRMPWKVIHAVHSEFGKIITIRQTAYAAASFTKLSSRESVLCL